MDVIAKATGYVNRGKVPVLTLDKPLFAIAKQSPWSWLDVYGDSKYCVMRDGLHIEIALLNALGHWWDGCGWLIIFFSETIDNLFALDTKVILFENAINNITRAEAMGREQYGTFVNHTSIYKPFNE